MSEIPAIRSRYLGALRTEAVHLKSGTVIQTDAPTDNQGKGELFSPTDLVAAALGSCMMTILGIIAERDNITLEGTHAGIVKIMSASPPRKIERIVIRLSLSTDRDLTAAERKKYENAARNCPVALSLHHSIDQDIEFNWRVDS